MLTKKSACTDKCHEERVKRDKLQKDFIKRHPEYCRVCNGSGTISYTENVAPGGWGPPGNNEQTFTEPCDHCIDDENCPLCGKFLTGDVDDHGDVDSVHCSHCGWDEDNKDVQAPDHECECWYEEWKQIDFDH